MRSQNVLSVLMHCFAICCLASVLWLFVVSSLAFGDGGGANAVIGGLGKMFLIGVAVESLSGDIPETVFFMFQMTFAIITPALIGSWRISFRLRRRPKMANMVEQGDTPLLAPERLGAIGYKIVLYPITLLLGGIKAMEDALAAIKQGAHPDALAENFMRST